MLKEFDFEDIVRIVKKRKQLSLAILLFCVSISLTLGLIFPQARAFISNRQTLENENKSLSELRQKLIQLDQIKYDPSYSQSAKIVAAAIPDNKPLLEFLASLDQVTRATSVELSSLELNPGDLSTVSAELSKKNKQAGVDSLPVSFKAVGSFAQVSEFMELLEKIAPFTTISQFSVAEGKARPAIAPEGSEPTIAPQEKVSVSLSCQTYFANVTVKTMANSSVPTLSNQDLQVLDKLKEFRQIELPEQKDIQGGLEDLFGLPRIEELYSVL